MFIISIIAITVVITAAVVFFVLKRSTARNKAAAKSAEVMSDKEFSAADIAFKAYKKHLETIIYLEEIRLQARKDAVLAKLSLA